MKNILKLFAVVLVAAFLLISCSKEDLEDIAKQGGAIKITNSAGSENYFIVVEGKEFMQAAEDLLNGKGTLIKNNASTTVSFDTIGVYTVVALFPAGFHDTVVLALGETKKVTIK